MFERVGQTVPNLRGVGWLGARLWFVASFLGLGVVAAACTWLALVALPGLEALVVVLTGSGSGGALAVLSRWAVVALAAAALALGGALSAVLGDSAVGVGALVAGVGALAFAAVSGATVTALFALCAAAGIGIVFPALVARAWTRAESRVGTAVGLAAAGYLLTNAVVLFEWYAAANWLGLMATSHLLADGVVGVPPRALVYQTFGSWQTALLVAGAGLVGTALAWFAVVDTPSLEGVRTAVGRVRAETEWTPSRAPLAAVLVGTCGAWTAATALLVHDGVTAAITAPIVALAGRLVAVMMLVGVLAGGIAFDRAGPRPTLAAALFAAVVGPTLYTAAAGPATESVGAAPAGTPWLALALLVGGLGVGALLSLVFALPALVAPAVSGRVGVAAGIVLAAGLATALVARAVVPVDGRASPVVLALLVGPAALGVGALRWLDARPPGRATVGDGGEPR